MSINNTYWIVVCDASAWNRKCFCFAIYKSTILYKIWCLRCTHIATLSTHPRQVMCTVLVWLCDDIRTLCVRSSVSLCAWNMSVGKWTNERTNKRTCCCVAANYYILIVCCIPHFTGFLLFCSILHAHTHTHDFVNIFQVVCAYGKMCAVVCVQSSPLSAATATVQTHLW